MAIGIKKENKNGKFITLKTLETKLIQKINEMLEEWKSDLDSLNAPLLNKSNWGEWKTYWNGEDILDILWKLWKVPLEDSISDEEINSVLNIKQGKEKSNKLEKEMEV